VALDASRPLPEPPGVSPTSGLVDAVRYSVALFKGNLERQKEIRRLRDEVVEAQQAIDWLLSELGRRARQIELTHPAVSGEMDAIKGLERRREDAASQQGQLDERRQQELERYQAQEREIEERLAEVENAYTAEMADLKLREAERLQLGRAAADHEVELRDLERRATALDDKAAKTADGAAQRALTTEAAGLRAKIPEVEEARSGVLAEAARLDPVIVALREKTPQLNEQRRKIREEQQALARSREATIVDLDAQANGRRRELAEIESDISRKFIALGTVLNLKRAQSPELAELYQRVDEARSLMTSREAIIVELEAQCASYDRGAVRKAAMVVGGGVGALLLLILILVLAL
jgi:chromosome segregation ATPase